MIKSSLTQFILVRLQVQNADLLDQRIAFLQQFDYVLSQEATAT